MDRAPVTVPLQTGIKVIDSLIPVGRGQRELILGEPPDRQDCHRDRYYPKPARPKCNMRFYCATVSARPSVAKGHCGHLREKGAMDYTVVVVTEGNDPPGLAYIAPYAATSICGVFHGRGSGCMIVYDDLPIMRAPIANSHSCCVVRPAAKRFPATFFIFTHGCSNAHKHLRKELGGGALTALAHHRTEHRIYPLIFRLTDFHYGMGRSTFRQSHFEMGMLPAVMSENPSHVLEVKRNAQLIAQSR